MAKYRTTEIKTDKQLIEELKSHFAPFSFQDLCQIATNDAKMVMIGKIDDLVKNSVQGITSSQLRKLYDLVIGATSSNSIQIQRPQFAYIIAKQPNEEARKLMIFVDELAKLTTHDESVEQFKWLFESVVAFHKYHEALTDRRATHPEQEILEGISKAVNIKDLLDIRKSKDINKVLDQLEKLIGSVKEGITSTQIRKVYDKILAVKTTSELQFLRPYLAYTAARQEKEGGVRLLLLLLELCKQFNPVNTSLEAFKHTIEIIISFHKYFDTFDKGKKSPSELLDKAFKPFGDKRSEDLLRRDNLDYSTLQNSINELVLDNLDGIQTAQLRKLYDEVQATDTVDDLKMKRPLFLYTAGRQNNDKAKQIILLMNDLIKNVKNEKQLTSFKEFMEDIVAYQKYYDVVRDLQTKKRF